MVKCRRCGRTLTHPQSIIRGMGPTCYGKSYTYRRLLKEGKTKQEILEIPKDQIKKWAREVISEYRKKQRKDKIKKPRKTRKARINGSVRNYFPDKFQKDLIWFNGQVYAPLKKLEDKIIELEEEFGKNPSEQYDIGNEIEKLQEEFNGLISHISGGSFKAADRGNEIIEKIKKLRGK